jgi:hypothetical protein
MASMEVDPIYISHGALGENDFYLPSEEWKAGHDRSLFIPMWSTNGDLSQLSFDWDAVEGFDLPKPSTEDDLQVFRDAVEDLKPSYLSRLTRIVRDLANDGEEQPVVLVEGFGDASLGHESFHSQLASAEHRLLERKAKKDLWTWFLDWRDFALEVLDLRVSGHQVLDILKRARSAMRRRHKPPIPRPRRTPAERLLQLAESIVPHAPPRRLAIEPTTSEAG